MQVKARLLGLLSFDYPAFGKLRPVELSEGATVKDLRERLALPESKVHFVSVNGNMVGEDYRLAEGDEVVFFPAASGG
ncbi:MAG: MoaD/ThiS family protein [Pelotomaculum sp.]|uniref:Sulfur transfer protein n=1 Tax=Pelotomaculum thermopropionicum (strain DSM 13744 / JCM 10971 / SI) TaxID=370438 RepID=A5D500_PELTS|nr:MoaD/ThiS family protein [Pelotomaculum sp.]BAF58678.1 sulfur transfer protein [Pelotomaculum thermopropionicum SI]